MKSVNGQTMGYDGESRMVSWTDEGANPLTASFVHDGDGRRVKKVAGPVTTTYAYDPTGALAAAGGAAPATTGTLYVVLDQLGSTRLVTKAGAAVGCHDYLPFGEQIPGGWFGREGCYGTVDGEVEFTGQVLRLQLHQTAKAEYVWTEQSPAREHLGRDGTVIGTYERTGFDDPGPLGNSLYQRMAAQRQASNQFIAGFAATPAAVGVTGGMIAGAGATLPGQGAIVGGDIGGGPAPCRSNRSE